MHVANISVHQELFLCIKNCFLLDKQNFAPKVLKIYCQVFF